MTDRWWVALMSKKKQAGLLDADDDAFLDYDPEPYERELRAAWECYQFVKVESGEADPEFDRLHDVLKWWDYLVAE
jgi:hypothetical protein